MQYAPIANRYLDYVISCLPACVAGVSASSPPASGVLLALVLANIRQRRMRIVVASRKINLFRIIACLEELFSRSLKLSTSLLMSGMNSLGAGGRLSGALASCRELLDHPA